MLILLMEYNCNCHVTILFVYKSSLIRFLQLSMLFQAKVEQVFMKQSANWPHMIVNSSSVLYLITHV